MATHRATAMQAARRLDVRLDLRSHGCYRAAFANGIFWNLLNVSIAPWLPMRPAQRVAPAAWAITHRNLR
jgi:hypothetical protein